MTPVCSRIAHVSLLVADLDAALCFYRDTLGLNINPSRPDLGYPGAWLDIGDQQIHLLQLPNPDPVTGRPAQGGRDRHVALMVYDLDLLRTALARAGVAFTLGQSGRRALFCRDPDGNALEFVETVK